MQKLVLRCRYTLGDIVLLTAAVRDLHLCWPGRFQTDIRTGFIDLWANNPHLTSLHEYDPGVRVIDCDMPLVERSDQAGQHALHGFIDFLSEQLAVKLRLTNACGDIHLSAEERDGFSPLAEYMDAEIPYWLINAGGKYDCTVKWWEPDRFQKVVDDLRGRIQFVQVGAAEHRHPPLQGVIDLRGRTNVRDLVRLVHNSAGVLCGVTALMHLTAAVPPKRFDGGLRPAVVIAGGREPSHWEAYPGHQFIHTIGTLTCCARGGCWKSRVRPLHDGKDEAEKMCVDVRGNLPACMDLITANEVTRRIEFYLNGGHASVLSSKHAEQAAKALARSAKKPAVIPPVDFYSAPQAAADFIERIPTYPKRFVGRGIVICGGGVRLFTNAWVCIHMLRKLGCTLPIELWHLGKAEMDSTMEALVKPLGVKCIDASAQSAFSPTKINNGWALKPYAIIHSAFEEVLLLDADNVPARNPEFLFDSEEFKTHGAVFWPDQSRLSEDAPAWTVFNVPYRDESEFESGQVLVNKKKCWAPLRLCLWYNEHSRVFYAHVHGDKETFHLAFRRLAAPYAMIPHPAEMPVGAFYQHDFDGARLFQHRIGDKWDLLGRNTRVADFTYEEDCLGFVRDLAKRWDGQLTWMKETQAKSQAASTNGKSLKLAVVMVSCEEREELRAKTLRQLALTGWPLDQMHLMIDEGRLPTKVDRITHTGWRGLNEILKTDADYVLYLEDDVEFNPFLFENLRRWGVLARRELHIGSLSNFGIREVAWDVPGRAYLMHPLKVWGAQALLISRQMVRYCLEHWSDEKPEVDLKLGRIAAKGGHPFFFHCPSLVQHVGRVSTLGPEFHRTVDFDPLWKSAEQPAFQWIPAKPLANTDSSIAVHG